MPHAAEQPTGAPFVHHLRVRLAQSDAGGVVYFGHFAAYCHEAYEALLDSASFSIRRVLDEGAMAIPIVDVQLQLKAPLRVGDDVDVEVRIARLGRTSFTTSYVLRVRDAGASDNDVKTAVAATGTLTHVCIDRTTRTPTPVPDTLVAALQPLVVPTA